MSLFGKDTYNYITNEIDYEKLADAIVIAQERKEQKDRESFKKAKLSCVSKMILVAYGIAITCFVVGGIVSFLDKSYIKACIACLIAGVFGIMCVASYIMAKTKNKTYVLNVASVVLALVAIVMDVLK